MKLTYYLPKSDKVIIGKSSNLRGLLLAGFCPEKKNETKSTAPLKDSCIYLYDIEVETDKKYKDLVLDEMVCVKKVKKKYWKKQKYFIPEEFS